MIALKQDQDGRWSVPSLIELDSSTGQVILDRSHFPNAAGKIFFGRESGGKQLSTAVGKISSCILVVVGASSSKTPSIQRLLTNIFQSAAKTHVFTVQGHTDHQTIRAGIEALLHTEAGHVIVIGGGTTLDLGKAVAGLAKQEGGSEVASFQTGRRTIDPKKVLPWVAVPTTSGTGSESTNNAVVEFGEEKRSIRNIPPPSMIIADPSLTDSLPLPTTVVSLVDAVAQSLEVITHAKATPEIQAVALAAFLNLAQGLKELVKMTNNTPLRSDLEISTTIRTFLSWGSLLMGIAFAHAGLGLPHALVHFCQKYNLSHGQMVGMLLVPGLEVQAFHDPATALRLARVEQALACVAQNNLSTLNYGADGTNGAEPLSPKVDQLFGWLEDTIHHLFVQVGFPISLSQARLGFADLDWLVTKEHTLGAWFGIPRRQATIDQLHMVFQKAWCKD
jgi:alcohol dehydrogenase class IV